MMTVLKLKLACLTLLVLLGQLHGLPTSDDQDQLNYLKEKTIYDHNERAKFATSFNISSTAGLSQIAEVDINSATGKMIEQYFKNTNPHAFNVKIIKIFSIQRKYEQDIFELWQGKGGFEDKGRLLLWHGTKMDLLEGILDNGLQAPEYQAQLAKGGSAFVMTMQTMFGSGIFFADRSSKSAQYTEREGTGVLLLCEVALGQHMLKAADAHDLTSARRRPDSVMGLGKVIPDANGTHRFEAAYVHAGSTTSGRTSGGPKSLAHPYHNEYIVFDPTRIHIKFIVQIEWK